MYRIIQINLKLNKEGRFFRSEVPRPNGRGFSLTGVLRSPVRIFSISYSSPRPRLKRRGLRGAGRSMFKTIFRFALFVLILPSLCFADEIIKGHYCYTYGDNESLRKAREITRTLAIRDAVESFGVYIVSTGTVKNFVLTDDLVNTISSGYLKNIKVLEHTEKERTICDTIQGSISADEVRQIIDRAIQDNTITTSVVKGTNNGCLEILKVKKWHDQVKVTVKVIRPTGALASQEDLNAKQCFRVLVDFLDADGDPMAGTEQYIHNSPNTMLSGEIISLYFEIPYGAESYKAWLAE